MSGNTPKQIKAQGGHRAQNLDPAQPGTTGAIAFQHVVKLLRDVEAAGIKLTYKPETAAELLTADWLISNLERERGLPVGGIDLVPIIETGTKSRMGS